MAKFLGTFEIISAIEGIIKNAKQRVFIISPYIDFNDRYKLLIEEKNEQKIPVVIVWGKKKKQLKIDKQWIDSFEFVKGHFLKDLHAKCYANEKEAVIASMNIYEASQNNAEMGILISKTDDSEAFDALHNEINRLLKVKPAADVKLIGYCIRCKEQIKRDVKKPFCDKDYQKWTEFRDATYKEKHGVCHICGKPNDSSKEKPLCVNCFHKNKNLFK